MPSISIPAWNPCVGSSGNARFDIPGAIPLAGGSPADFLDDRPVDRGSSGYSALPTLGQIDAGAGWNQVIAYLQRQKQLMDTYSLSNMGAVLQPAFLAGDRRVSHYDIADNSSSTASPAYMRAQVDDIRRQWGLPAWTWVYGPPVATDISLSAFPMRGVDLAEVRQALEPTNLLGKMDLTQQVYNTSNIQRARVREVGVSKNLGRTGSYVAATTTILRIGIVRTGSGNGGTGDFYRTVLYFYVPEWLDDAGFINTVELKGNVGTLIGSPGTITFYNCTNQTQPIAGSDFTAIGTSIGSMAGASGAFTVSIPAADVVACADGLFKIIARAANDAAWNTGDAIASSNYLEIDNNYTLEIDLN